MQKIPSKFLLFDESANIQQNLLHQNETKPAKKTELLKVLAMLQRRQEADKNEQKVKSNRHISLNLLPSRRSYAKRTTSEWLTLRNEATRASSISAPKMDEDEKNRKKISLGHSA
jgi:hypothetical protein